MQIASAQAEIADLEKKLSSPDLQDDTHFQHEGAKELQALKARLAELSQEKSG